MKHIVAHLLITALLLLEYCHGTADTKEYPCPLAADIEPCTCAYDNDGLGLYCDYSTTDEQLSAAFQAEFPITEFYRLSLHTNPYITKLGYDLTSLTFKQIQTPYTPIQLLSDNFLFNNAYTLEHLDLYDAHLSEDSFPARTIEDLTVLKVLYLGSNNFTLVPYMKSDTLNALSFGSNKIDHLSQGILSNLPSLEDLNIQYNKIKELQPGSVTISSSLYNLDLSSNEIYIVHQDAFDITPAGEQVWPNLQVNLQYNQITTLEETAFRPLLDRNCISLLINGNPLECGCDIAWLVTNSAYLSVVEGQCEDGNLIQDLDPAYYQQYC